MRLDFFECAFTPRPFLRSFGGGGKDTGEAYLRKRLQNKKAEQQAPLA